MRFIVPMALALLGQPAWAQVPAVVTDIAPVQSLTAQVMGDLGQPTMLIQPDIDPHDYQLRPSQGRAMADADLVIWMGPPLTPWMGEMIETLGNGETTSLALLALPDLPMLIKGQAVMLSGDQSGTGDVDPHAWLDPLNAIRFVSEIAGALVAADPENAAVYRANAADASARLTAMTDQLAQQLNPLESRALVTYHDAYRYFMARFGLQFAGSLAPADATPPGAARLAGIRDLLAANPDACLFTEPGANLQLLDAVLPGSGGTAPSLGPLTATQPPGPLFYESLIRRLGDTIAACADR